MKNNIVNKLCTIFQRAIIRIANRGGSTMGSVFTAANRDGLIINYQLFTIK